MDIIPNAKARRNFEETTNERKDRFSFIAMVYDERDIKTEPSPNPYYN